MGGSGVIPRWKIAREVDRFSQQVKAAIGLIWEPFVQRRYDRNRAKLLIISDGIKPLQTKVAVYLIFQPNKILQSTIDTCRILDTAGYSMLIVSNAPLNKISLDALTQVTWKIMQRPNYGYDFGGYRDGILFLRDNEVIPDRLLVLNDSVWYPLLEKDTLLERLEASGLDVSGTIVHRSFHKTILRRRLTRVIESYFFLFSRKVVQSHEFASFWENYRMSSIKYNAVHRGERRITEAMLAAGFSADGLFGREEFLEALVNKDSWYLIKALIYSNYTNKSFEQSRKILVSGFNDSLDWRERATAHFRLVSSKHSFFASFPFVAAGELDVPLIKRSNGALQVMARKSVLDAIHAGDLCPVRNSVMAELTASHGKTHHQEKLK